MVGDAGLAGICVAWPLVAVVLAAGTGIGMGGAVISSVRLGEGSKESSRAAVGHTLSLLALSSVPIMVVLLLFGQPLLYVIGGRDQILQMAQDYLSVIAWGAFFQVMASGCIPLIRSKGKVMFALVALSTGGLLNCLLDLITVIFLGWGVVGAALSTVASQVLVFCFGIYFFAKKINRVPRTDLKLHRALVAKTLKIGFAPFALTLLPEVTTVVVNITAQAEGGATAQAAFAVISYMAVAVQWVIQGVNDGSQPLVSTCYGAGDRKNVLALRRTNYVIAVSIGLLGMVLLNAFCLQLADIFGISAEATHVLVRGMLLFSLALGFYGISHASTSFFYAAECAQSASVLIIGEAVCMVLFSLLLPNLLGLDGVWLTVVAAQIVVSTLGVVLIRKNRTYFDVHMKEQREKRLRCSSDDSSNMI